MRDSENGKYLIDFQFIDKPLIVGGIGLYQIGTKVCDSDTYSPPHRHLDWFELTIARSGKGIVTTDGASENIASGDIYLSFPCDVHSVRSSADDRLTYSFFSFYFTDEKYKSIFDGLAMRCDAAKSRVFRNSLLPELVDFLTAEIADGDPADNRLVALTLEQLVLLIPKFCAASYTPATTNPKSNEQITFMIMRYLSLNLFSIENLSQVADYLGYNYSYLSKIFKKTTGKSITDYYVSLKMDHAKTLIRDAGFSVTKTAEILNYSSVYAFSKAFKNFYGVSPTQSDFGNAIIP